jgi:flavin-dependent dehydrogenase
MNRLPVAVPGMVLVGDAAGLANPLSGEGIGHAMESGELAARVLQDAIHKGDGSEVSTYRRLLRERFGRGSVVGRRAVRLVTRPSIMKPAARAVMACRPLARVGVRAMVETEDVASPSGTMVGALLSLGSWRGHVPKDGPTPVNDDDLTATSN